ncbi:hypothetical protein [Pseudomonas fluorescens]|uniref:Uncharacterized protein n=1 Tax=Pseudomonas fluorescens TaxID=294 RepID=A0A423MBN1_PSEFL|nr:hypothetical protein [Pseudomonas fluorescens]RON80692.1 hypothetical protein BK670_10840 [Pseudomonas fluorescens]
MANETAASVLYLETCKLAYTETNMSNNPRAPFQSTDEDTLSVQATEVADAARDLRNKHPASLDDAQVNEAIARIREAQTLFDYINNTNGAPPPKHVIFGAVANAVDQVNSL